MRDVASSPSSNTNMAATKAQAVAAERRKTKKAEQEAEKAAQEKAEALAENARLKAQLQQQLAQHQEKSGRSRGTSVATAPSKKRKEAPSNGSVAHKSRRSESKQGLSGGSMPGLAPLEAKMADMLGAKRQYGGRRQKDKDGVPDEMLTRIHTAIKCGVFDDFKYVLGPKGKKKLIKAVLDKLKMDGFYGKGSRVKRNQAWFAELYGDEVVALLNQVRSGTSTEVKKAVKAFFDTNNGELPSTEDYQRLITRDLDLKNERDVALFEWYQMVLMPRACGSATNWNKAKREYHPLSTGAPKNSEKPYITPETEAYAVWLCKGNAIRWKRQFEIAEMPKYKGRIQRLLGPKRPKKKQAEVVELKEPEKADAVDDGDDDEEEGDKTDKDKGDSDDEEKAEETEKVEEGAVDEVSQSFLMFIWHCFIAQLPLF